jgi:hypothetical protein
MPRLAGGLDGPATPIPVVALLILAFGVLVTSGPVAANSGRWRLGLSIAPPVPPG